MKHTIRAEIFKFYWDIRRYLFNYTVGLIAEIIFIGGLYWSVSRFEKSKEIIFGGLVLWLFARGALSDASTIIGEERYYGTFERVSVTKSSLFSILISRLIVNFLFESIKVMILAGILYIIFRPPVRFSFVPDKILFIWIITILVIMCLYSWGFIIASLQLIWKRTGAIIPIIEYIFLVFSGVIVDVSTIPRLLVPVSNLIPITWEIKILQKLFEGQSIIIPTIHLIIYTIIILQIGYLIFNIAVKHTKKTGGYGFY
jgi:ABC-2 type transport system permease protein